MKASTLLTLIVVFAAAMVPAASYAQFGRYGGYGGYGGYGSYGRNSDYQDSFDVQLGAFFPSNGTIRNQLNSTWFTAEAEYNFASRKNATFVPDVFVEGEGTSKNYYDNFGNSFGLNLSTVGIGVGGKYYFNQPSNPDLTPYVGAGVGVYTNNTTLYNGYYGDSSGYNTTNGGYKVNVGVLFRHRFTLEADYTDPGDIDGYNLGGTSVTVGALF